MIITDHPARTAGLASQAAVRARDKQAWLALFAEDAIVEDPIGPSGLDPVGEGHRGPTAIATFWDAVVAATETIEFLFSDSFACGSEVAFTGTVRSSIGGRRIDADGVFIYRVDNAGKITALRTFWEIDRAMETARPLD
ncbi:nuclear transport factor 2 family protein [Nocardia sp. CNY236]|uniref:nuclear transport factor 2 family protein n=1 Tax=Nocardia sp. CNY236 TaxID=1169152 RepID=UPI0004088898|nr:nuclear transport factor 2 family protein [Nocardia sp. CNY236]